MNTEQAREHHERVTGEVVPAGHMRCHNSDGSVTIEKI